MGKARRYLWLDLEMTGLHPPTERILEVGVVVSDKFFRELETYHAVVRQEWHFLEGMDAWNQEQHRASGLLEEIPGGKTIEEVDQELSGLTRKYFGKRPVILCGNSIHHDRKFIDLYLPHFASLLDFRMLDVTTLKLTFRDVFKRERPKNNAHRALDDARESMTEYVDYLRWMGWQNEKNSPQPQPEDSQEQ